MHQSVSYDAQFAHNMKVIPPLPTTRLTTEAHSRPSLLKKIRKIGRKRATEQGSLARSLASKMVRSGAPDQAVGRA